MSAEIEEALKYPLSNLKAVAVGGIYLFFYYLIYFLGFFYIGSIDFDYLGTVYLIFYLLFIPLGLLPLFGYTVEVSKSILKGEDKPPKFNNLGNLFVTGLKMLSV